jgi:hypothetical protein
MPPDAIYVGRPSRWGNPFVIGVDYMWLGKSELPYPIATWREPGTYDHGIRVERLIDQVTAVAWFEAWYSGQVDRPWFGVAPLRGHDLACWCRLCPAHADGLPVGVECPDCAPCHAQTLLELANP